MSLAVLSFSNSLLSLTAPLPHISPSRFPFHSVHLYPDMFGLSAVFLLPATVMSAGCRERFGSGSGDWTSVVIGPLREVTLTSASFFNKAAVPVA